MSRQITLRVSPQQLEAYEIAAERVGLQVKPWADDILRSGVGIRGRLRAAPPFTIGKEEVRDQKLAIWLHDKLEARVDTAATESRVSATTFCSALLDTAAGISRFSHYLKRVS